jgi:uncharacterized protein
LLLISATIDVRVIPRAGKSAIAGVRGNALLVRLNAPPVDGAANAELIDVLADALDIPKRAISIVAGERSRQKRVCIEGVTNELVASTLGPKR